MERDLQNRLCALAKTAGMLSQVGALIQTEDYTALAVHVRTEGESIVSELNQRDTDPQKRMKRYAFDALVGPSEECEDLDWLHQLQELYLVIPATYRLEARRILKKAMTQK